MFIVGSGHEGQRSGDRCDIGYGLDGLVAGTLQKGLGYGGTD
jgi:hypothetical protein